MSDLFFPEPFALACGALAKAMKAAARIIAVASRKMLKCSVMVIPSPCFSGL